MIWWMALAAHATDSDDINLCGDEGTRVVVLPSASPPTRTRATFTLVDGCGDEESPLGASTFVEWDPLLDGVVARSVTLAEGEWRMTLWSEPRTLGSSSSRDDDISWHLKNVRAESHDRYEATVLTGVARWSPDSSTPMEETILDLRVTQKVSLEAAVGQFGQAVADGAPVEGLRSTSSAFDSIATRATSVAGEIVIERARSQSFEAVRGAAPDPGLRQAHLAPASRSRQRGQVGGQVQPRRTSSHAPVLLHLRCGEGPSPGAARHAGRCAPGRGPSGHHPVGPVGPDRPGRG